MEGDGGGVGVTVAEELGDPVGMGVNDGAPGVVHPVHSSVSMAPAAVMDLSSRMGVVVLSLIPWPLTCGRSFWHPARLELDVEVGSS